MPTILVVDDSEVDRKLVGGLLQKEPHFSVRFAHNGREAITAMREVAPDLVVTDMQMPERDGLELVRAIRLHYAHVPVILMTSHGSDRLAVEALEQGAASYVPKGQLADKLIETVDEVLAIARADRTYERLIGCLTRTEFTFSLENDDALIDPLVDLIQQITSGMKLCEANDRYRLGMALKAALLNALYRGNLELSSEQIQDAREHLLHGQGLDEVAQRRKAKPFCDRRIHVKLEILNDTAEFVIRDEGPGFAVQKVLAANKAEALEGESGRGLLLMRAFMDEVRFNEKGNEVTLIKKREVLV